MGKMLEKKQPLPMWRRIVLALLLSAMAMLAVFMLVSYFMGKRLSDEIIKISRAGEPITFRDLQTQLQPHSTADDAAAYYAEALSGIPPGDLESLRRMRVFYRKNIVSLPANQFPSDVREKVTQNLTNLKPVLEKFDKAADLSLSHFDIGVEQGMQAYKTRLGSVQIAALLLSLRTLDSMLDGRDDDAVNSAISSLKMIRIFDSCPIISLHAARVIFVAQVCHDIHILLGYGHPSDKSLAKLQKVLAETVAPNALERMFYAERVYQIEAGRNLIPEKIKSRFLQHKVPDIPERVSLPRTRWARLRVRQKAARFLRDMAGLIADVRQPWPGPLDKIITNPDVATKKPSALFTRAASSVRLTAETLVFVRCTTLAIAIERYRRVHGKLPPSLDDVAPDYIDSVPLDLFTSKKLLYHYDEETYVVYSTGINRLDDGGLVVRGPDEKSLKDSGLRVWFRKSQ